MLALAVGCAQRQPIARSLFSVPDVIRPGGDELPASVDSGGDQLADVADDIELRRTADITRNLKRGANETQAGRYGQAAKFYERVLRDDPDNGEAHHRLAVLADLRGDFIAAERSYGRVLEIRQNDPDLFNDLGYSYLLQERFAEAEQSFRQALALKGDHARALANLEMLYRRIGDDARARAVAEAMPPQEGAPVVASFLQPMPSAAVSSSFVTNTARRTVSAAEPPNSSLPLWTTESSEAAMGMVSPAANSLDSESVESPTSRFAAKDPAPITLTGHVLPGGREFPTDVLSTTAGLQLPPPRWQMPP